MSMWFDSSLRIRAVDTLRRQGLYEKHFYFKMLITFEHIALNELNRPKINLYTFNDLIRTKVN